MAASSGGIKLGRAYVLIDAVDRTKLAINSALHNMSNFADNMAAIGTNLTIGATISVTLAAGASKAFRDFEEMMLKVKAKSKDTAGATVRAYDNLTRKALEMGRVTRFTATQVADAMAGMAAAGLSRQTIDKSMKSILDLAVATGTDIQTAARISMASMQQFGLAAEDVGSICDTITASVNNSALAIEDIGETFKYAAPLAKEFGMSVKDLAVIVGALGNVGIKGSQAGTSLRQMMTKLANPSAFDLKKFNEEFGANVQRDTIDIVDGQAVARTRNMLDILQDIGTALRESSNQDPQKQLAVFSNLFGRYAMTGASALSSMKNFDTMINNIRNSEGTAAKTAEIMNSGIAGLHYACVSAFQDVQIVLGKALNPTVEYVYKSAIKLFNTVSEFVARNPQVVSAFAAATAAMAASGVSLMAAAAGLKLVSITGGMFTSIIGTATSAAYGFAIAVNGWTTPLYTANQLLRVLSATMAGMALPLKSVGRVISSFAPSFSGGGRTIGTLRQNAPLSGKRARKASMLLRAYREQQRELHPELARAYSVAQYKKMLSREARKPLPLKNRAAGALNNAREALYAARQRGKATPAELMAISRGRMMSSRWNTYSALNLVNKYKSDKYSKAVGGVFLRHAKGRLSTADDTLKLTSSTMGSAKKVYGADVSAQNKTASALHKADQAFYRADTAVKTLRKNTVEKATQDLRATGGKFKENYAALEAQKKATRSSQAMFANTTGRAKRASVEAAAAANALTMTASASKEADAVLKKNSSELARAIRSHSNASAKVNRLIEDGQARAKKANDAIIKKTSGLTQTLAAAQSRSAGLKSSLSSAELATIESKASLEQLKKDKASVRQIATAQALYQGRKRAESQARKSFNSNTASIVSSQRALASMSGLTPSTGFNDKQAAALNSAIAFRDSEKNRITGLQTLVTQSGSNAGAAKASLSKAEEESKAAQTKFITANKALTAAKKDYERNKSITEKAKADLVKSREVYRESGQRLKTVKANGINSAEYMNAVIARDKAAKERRSLRRSLITAQEKTAHSKYSYLMTVGDYQKAKQQRDKAAKWVGTAGTRAQAFVKAKQTAAGNNHEYWSKAMTQQRAANSAQWARYRESMRPSGTRMLQGNMNYSSAREMAANYTRNNAYMKERMRVLRMQSAVARGGAGRRLALQMVETRFSQGVNAFALGTERWRQAALPFREGVGRFVRATAQHAQSVYGYIRSIPRAGFRGTARGAGSMAYRMSGNLFAGFAPGGAIWRGITQSFSSVFSAVRAGFSNVFRFAFNTIARIAMAPLTWVAGLSAVVVATGRFKEVLAGAYIAVSAFAVGIKAAFDGIKAVFKWYSSGISKSMGKRNDTIDPVLELWKNAYSGVSKTIHDSYGTISDSIQRGQWGDVFKMLSATWGVIREQLKSTLSAQWLHMKLTFMETWNAITDTLFGGNGGLYGILNWALQGLWNLAKWTVNSLSYAFGVSTKSSSYDFDGVKISRAPTIGLQSKAATKETYEAFDVLVKEMGSRKMSIPAEYLRNYQNYSDAIAKRGKDTTFSRGSWDIADVYLNTSGSHLRSDYDKLVEVFKGKITGGASVRSNPYAYSKGVVKAQTDKTKAALDEAQNGTSEELNKALKNQAAVERKIASKNTGTDAKTAQQKQKEREAAFTPQDMQSFKEIVQTIPGAGALSESKQNAIAVSLAELASEEGLIVEQLKEMIKNSKLLWGINISHTDTAIASEVIGRAKGGDDSQTQTLLKLISDGVSYSKNGIQETIAPVDSEGNRRSSYQILQEYQRVLSILTPEDVQASKKIWEEKAYGNSDNASRLLSTVTTNKELENYRANTDGKDAWERASVADRSQFAEDYAAQMRVKNYSDEEIVSAIKQDVVRNAFNLESAGGIVRDITENVQTKTKGLFGEDVLTETPVARSKATGAVSSDLQRGIYGDDAGNARRIAQAAEMQDMVKYLGEYYGRITPNLVRSAEVTYNANPAINPALYRDATKAGVQTRTDDGQARKALDVLKDMYMKGIEVDTSKRLDRYGLQPQEVNKMIYLQNKKWKQERDAKQENQPSVFSLVEAQLKGTVASFRSFVDARNRVIIDREKAAEKAKQAEIEAKNKEKDDKVQLDIRQALQNLVNCTTNGGSDALRVDVQTA